MSEETKDSAAARELLERADKALGHVSRTGGLDITERETLAAIRTYLTNAPSALLKYAALATTATPRDAATTSEVRCTCAAAAGMTVLQHARDCPWTMYGGLPSVPHDLSHKPSESMLDADALGRVLYGQSFPPWEELTDGTREGYQLRAIAVARNVLGRVLALRAEHKAADGRLDALHVAARTPGCLPLPDELNAVHTQVRVARDALFAALDALAGDGGAT